MRLCGNTTLPSNYPITVSYFNLCFLVTDLHRKYYDSNEIKKLGEIYTPWPSWHIVASNNLPITTVGPFLEAVNEGIAYFNTHKNEAVEYISTHLDYSKEDAQEWLGTVEFAGDVREIDENAINDTLKVLREAGVVKDSNVSYQEVVLSLS